MDFGEALDHVRGHLLFYKALEQLEEVLSAAVDAQAMIAELQEQQAAQQGRLDAIEAKITEAVARDASRLSESEQRFAGMVAAKGADLAVLEVEHKERMAELALQYEAKKVEVAQDIADLNARRTGAVEKHKRETAKHEAKAAEAEQKAAEAQAKLEAAQDAIAKLKQAHGL